ncbi:HlyD family type I secretion periplasmic adaptor subunit [Endozoicomonas euniceicola]|uniref:Membrane fusion protein (MFP) family protein n=1 Tax=Endozoicomonas euniceicola TaxID=1234143 RepID=A0ABY6GR36_9GAMM|nr:HlyD family type I secretion periplasmic adaptor subunit [Endozoicomonas euniceicola]UYM14606.1 HlyD family type I secretion periplasmic adaptor subunit [Endozoicomonas euniceicola]
MLNFLKKVTAFFSSREENEFLPAAVEVLETPASPLKHVLTISICLLFVIALVWSWFGKMDVIVEAEGRVIPDGYSKKISPIQVARVSNIYVTEGSQVKKGDKLIELIPNPSDLETNTEQKAQDISTALLSALREETLIRLINTPGLSRPVSVNLKQEAINNQLTFDHPPTAQRWAAEDNALKSELEAFLSSDQSMEKNLDELSSSLAADGEEIERLKLLNPIHNKLASSTKALYEKKMMSEVDWLIRREKQIDTAQQLKVMMQRQKEHQARYQALLAERQQKRETFIAGHLKEYLTAVQQIDHGNIVMAKASMRDENQVLTAPIDGTVQQIQIHSSGDVVQPGQPVMVIVPANSRLTVEAMVLNKDIRWVKPEQKVQVKIESFPYTRYGYLEGSVQKVSGDAINDEQKGWFFQAFINLDRDWFQVEQKKIRIQPGMTLTADVIVSQRRLLEYFLSPLLRYQKEVFRETM